MYKSSHNSKCMKKIIKECKEISTETRLDRFVSRRPAPKGNIFRLKWNNPR